MFTDGLPAIMTIWLSLTGALTNPQVLAYDTKFQNYYSCQRAQQELTTLSLPENVTIKTSCNVTYADSGSHCFVTDFGPNTSHPISDELDSRKLITFVFSQNNASITDGDYASLKDCNKAKTDTENTNTLENVSILPICIHFMSQDVAWACSY